MEKGESKTEINELQLNDSQNLSNGQIQRSSRPSLPPKMMVSLKLTKDTYKSIRKRRLEQVETSIPVKRGKRIVHRQPPKHKLIQKPSTIPTGNYPMAYFD